MSNKEFSLYWRLLKKSSNYLILISLSVSVLSSVTVSTLADTLNSTIFVKVDIKETDANNVTASIYNGHNNKTQVIDSNLGNKSYLFKFDVTNVPISSEEEIENADEDEDVEFRVCASIDKYKNNSTPKDCENIVVDDTKENITLSIK